ncbi:U-box domain-containing protein 12 [Glycine soja]
MVIAILNLSLCDENKELIASHGAVKALVAALERGTMTAKENATCTLVRLSHNREEEKVVIRKGAASGEASRRRGIAREERGGDCALRAVFDQGVTELGLGGLGFRICGTELGIRVRRNWVSLKKFHHR